MNKLYRKLPIIVLCLVVLKWILQIEIPHQALIVLLQDVADYLAAILL